MSRLMAMMSFPQAVIVLMLVRLPCLRVASALVKDQSALQLCGRDSQGNCALQAVVFLQLGALEVR